MTDKKQQLTELKDAIDQCIESGASEEDLIDLKDAVDISFSDIPTTITLGHYKKLRDHINNRFNPFMQDKNGKMVLDENGNQILDLDKCQRNIGYSISNWYNNYNGLVLKEKQKLAEIYDKLKLAKASAYNDIKMQKVKYELDSRGLNIMVEGHELTRAKQLEYDKQQAYVEFCENALKQIGYYANGVKVMLQRAEVKGRYAE